MGFCKHYNMEVYHDAAKNAFWAQCPTCFQIGPMRYKASLAKAALRVIEARKPNKYGLPSGTITKPKSKPLNEKFLILRCLPHLFLRLDEFVYQVRKFNKGLKKSRSAGVRHILSFPIEKLVAIAREEYEKRDDKGV